MSRRDVVTVAAGATTSPSARLSAAEAQRRVGALLNATEIDPRFQSIVGECRKGLATFTTRREIGSLAISMLD